MSDKPIHHRRYNVFVVGCQVAFGVPISEVFQRGEGVYTVGDQDDIRNLPKNKVIKIGANIQVQRVV